VGGPAIWKNSPASCANLTAKINLKTISEESWASPAKRKRQYDTLSGGGATWLTGPGLMLPQAELRSKARSQSQAKANALA